MPRYVVSSESPISVRAIERPDLPDFPDLPEGWPPAGGIGGRPPARPEPLPPLPPGGGELPIDPSPEFPMVPIPPGGPPGWWPPGMVWPPIAPELPDLSGKSLVLALLYVSRHAPRWGWVVVDHEAAKEKLKQVADAIRDQLPAGGIGGRPPQTRPPA